MDISPPINAIIDHILEAEGPASNDPLDRGGATAFGISQRSNPEAWKNGPPTLSQARDIYFQKYVVGPGFDKIGDPALMAQLVDFGVTSGPMIAIQKLQGVLGITIDGVLGPDTLQSIQTLPNVSNALVGARVKMICQLVVKNPSQLKFLVGWVNRAFEFLK